MRGSVLGVIPIQPSEHAPQFAHERTKRQIFNEKKRRQQGRYYAVRQAVRSSTKIRGSSWLVIEATHKIRRGRQRLSCSSSAPRSFDMWQAIRAIRQRLFHKLRNGRNKKNKKKLGCSDFRLAWCTKPYNSCKQISAACFVRSERHFFESVPKIQSPGARLCTSLLMLIRRSRFSDSLLRSIISLQ